MIETIGPTRQVGRVTVAVCVFTVFLASACSGGGAGPGSTEGPSPIGIRVFDEELVFEVRLLDNNDRVLARDQVVLTPRCPEGDQAAFCYQICAG